MDTVRLEHALAETFDSTDAERRVVVRQARDLADSGKVERDRGHELTVETVLKNLSEAPEGSDLVERWNWWIGALETAYGEYERFSVYHVRDEPDINS